MTLKIRLGTVGYNNKILISNEKFNLGKNHEVNSLEIHAIKTNFLELTHALAISQKIRDNNSQ